LGKEKKEGRARKTTFVAKGRDQEKIDFSYSVWGNRTGGGGPSVARSPAQSGRKRGLMNLKGAQGRKGGRGCANLYHQKGGLPTNFFAVLTNKTK